ncbi:MAG TPA: hypothetical protein VK674_00475 [Candidatus Limnocylindria bacterium]|nr:hypothetical protein [Candidatus Limnocylindria bacterium]
MTESGLVEQPNSLNDKNFAAEIQELERLFAPGCRPESSLEPRPASLSCESRRLDESPLEHAHSKHGTAHDTPHLHNHPHNETLSVSDPNIRTGIKDRITYGVAAIGSLALSAFELKTGVARDALGVVMDSLHNVGDALAYGLQAVALAAEGKITETNKETSAHRKWRKAAAAAIGIAAGASLLHTGFHTGEFIGDAADEPRQLLHMGLETSNLLPVAVGAAGNFGISEWMIRRTANNHTVHQEAVEHAEIDRKTSFKLLATALIPSAFLRPVAEIGVGVWYSLKSRHLAQRMWRSPDATHEHEHGGRHSEPHGDDETHAELPLHRHNSLKDKIKLLRTSAKTKAIIGISGLAPRKVLTKEDAAGERRVSRGRVMLAGLGSLAMGALGLYTIQKFGLGFDHQSLGGRHMANHQWGGSRVLGQMPTGVPLPKQPTTPDLPTIVRLRPGDNPWKLVGEHADRLGIHLTLGQHDAWVDATREASGHMSEQDATRLPVSSILHIPDPGVINL